MDIQDCWLLHTVAFNSNPVDILVASDEEFEVWSGYHKHWWPTSEIIERLDRLFQSGDLIARRSDARRLNFYESFVPDRQQIEAGLARKIHFDYGLTMQGGAKWEAFAGPTRSSFVNGARGPGFGNYSISGPDRNRVASALEKWSRLQEFSVLDVVWESMHPWKVTYWKTFPAGYTIHFKAHYINSTGPDWQQHPLPWQLDPLPPMPSIHRGLFYGYSPRPTPDYEKWQQMKALTLEIWGLTDTE